MLSAPRQITFIVAVIVFLVGLIGQLAGIAAIAPFAFWLVVIAFVILLVGNLFKGL